MAKYKINFIYENNKNINEIITNVLYKELNKYIKMTCKKQKDELTSPITYISLKDKGDSIDAT